MSGAAPPLRTVIVIRSAARLRRLRRPLPLDRHGAAPRQRHGARMRPFEGAAAAAASERAAAAARRRRRRHRAAVHRRARDLVGAAGAADAERQVAEVVEAVGAAIEVASSARGSLRRPAAAA